MKKRKKWDCAITSAFSALKLLRLQQRGPGGHLQFCLGGGEGGQFRGGGGFLSAPGGRGGGVWLSGTLVVSIPLPSLPLEQWADALWKPTLG